MFRLEDQISSWCTAVAVEARLSRAELEELRDHLVTEIDRQRALGADLERAFELATAKLGSVAELSREYTKNKKIARAISAIANVPLGSEVLGGYLAALAALMTLFHVMAGVSLFAPDGARPGSFGELDGAVLFGSAVLIWLPFAWGGVTGIGLLRGRKLGPGSLLGIAALLAVQVPVFGAAPLPAFELAGGLQVTLLFGAERLFEYRTLPDVHINSPVAAPYFFGLNLIAAVAFSFTAAKCLDYAREAAARVGAEEVFG